MSRQESPLPAAIAKIYSDIEEKKIKDQEQRDKDEKILQEKKEIYERIQNMARKHGGSRHTSVGTGAGPGIIGFRFESAYQLITPPVKIKTPTGNVEMQIVEELIGGSGYSVNHDGFSITVNSNVIFHVNSNGEATNWLGEEASPENREFVSSEILDPLEKRLKRLPKKSRESTDDGLLSDFPELRDAPIASLLPRRPRRGGYRRMGAKANGIDRDMSLPVSQD